MFNSYIGIFSYVLEMTNSEVRRVLDLIIFFLFSD